MPDVHAIVCCPRCGSRLDFGGTGPRCANMACDLAREGFPIVRGQPVLIDFQDSIFTRADYDAHIGSVIEDRDDSGASWRTRFWALMMGENRVAPQKSQEMLAIAKVSTPSPRILVIGGGAIGSGARGLYEDAATTIVGTDVYASVNTSVVADAHHLPFVDDVFDGVWIQAVLEHVLEPDKVAAEIHRVLKPGGLVYADTPFLQAVHEGAYDFTRFTQSGHRWLFRRFEQIDAGVVLGAGSALVWAVRYFFRALGMPDRYATLAAFPVFWLRYFDGVAKPRASADAACGTYFFGQKGGRCLQPRDMVDYYEKATAGRNA